MLVIVYWLLFNVVAGIPLAKLSSSSVPFNGTKDLLSQIMLFKDNHKALLSVLSDADPAKLNEVITLLTALLTTSQAELLGLTTSSDNADTAFTDAVASHNAAIVAQTNGLGPLATTRDNAIALANTNYNNGVAALQDAVNAAKLIVDSTNSTKVTANGVLAVDQGRLNSEITTLRQVIQLMEGLLGINTFSPTSSPTTTGDGYIDLAETLGMGECIDTTRSTMLARFQGYISGARGDLAMAETGCKTACTSMSWCIAFYIGQSQGSCNLLAEDANYVRDNHLYAAGYAPDGVGFWTSTDIVIDMNRVGTNTRCQCFVKQV